MRRNMSRNLGLYKYLWPGSVYIHRVFVLDWVTETGLNLLIEVVAN